MLLTKNKTALSFLDELGLKISESGASTGTQWFKTKGKLFESRSPVDGSLIGTVNEAGRSEYDKIIDTAQKAFKAWRMIPAPKRGEIVRQIGEELRQHKEPLGRLVSWEMGKSLQGGNCTDSPCTPSASSTGCMNSGIRSALPASFQLSISRWRCGRGTPCLPGCAGMSACGNLRRKRPFAR